MNPTARGYAKFVSTALLTGAFLMSNEMPLLARESQEPAAAQKQDDSLPDAPQSQAAQTQNQQQPAAPSGAAGAKAATVKGAPVAQPVGAAVAPARQRGHRSLFIKLGLLAGAGIAAGSVVALSGKSPARPPGASSSSHQ
jgi:predicted lipid-binding transport protein (Tim44 family)